MRSSARSGAGHSRQSAISYHQVPSATGPLGLIPAPGGAGGTAMRGVNFRVRVFLALCVAIVAGVLLANVVFTRRHRRNDLFTLPKAGYAMDDASAHMEHDEVILDRIHRTGHRPVHFPQKLVHFDLKGAPLNPAYVEKILPLLARLGTTGLLIEYEDMFPYDGHLAQIAAHNAYSKQDIRRILNAARSNNLTVIPLIQTFGHLEFVLKLQQYKHLREVPHNPQALCPSRNASLQLVHEMLRQVAELHRGYISHLHIGSDEVFMLGRCNTCLQRMADLQWSRNELFLDHVSSVVHFVQKMGLQVILWDDMFRQVDEEILKRSPLAKLVEVMVWSYGKGVPLSGVFSKYASAGFTGIWAASAFKGASSPSAQMPNYRQHLLNHYSWTQLLQHFTNKINLKGIAITGWQRYDHFGSLCELFPVAVPVLALCLGYIQTGCVNNQVLKDIRTVLGCNRVLPVFYETTSPDRGDFYFSSSVTCQYPGSEILTYVSRWSELQSQKQQIMASNYYQGWMSEMNRRRRFTSPEHLIQGFPDLSARVAECVMLRQQLKSDLAQVTDASTANEWIETFLDPLQKWFEQLQLDVQEMLAKDEWPRRPLYDKV